MKFTFVSCTLSIGLLVATCKKQDYCPEPPKPGSTCDLVQSTLLRDENSGDESGLFSEFRKEYDNSGKVRKVVAGLYTLRLGDSVSMLLKYNGTTVYFLNELNPADTLTTATFDSQSRLQKMTYGNGFRHEFETTEFFYEANRLVECRIESAVMFIFYFSYDINGNVARISGNYDNAGEGIFFTYDLSMQAKRQWYTDHFPESGVSNTVNLAQFMGWLPGLNPVNKRTHWTYIYNDDQDDSTPPEVREQFLTNHVYDSNGNLVSYRSGDAVFTSTWNCTEGNANRPN